MVNRRNFLKNAAIFTCGYCLGNISTNFHNFNILDKNQDNIFFRVSFMITHHCNLNCAGCDHFSPLAPIYFMPLDIFERDIAFLAQSDQLFISPDRRRACGKTKNEGSCVLLLEVFDGPCNVARSPEGHLLVIVLNNNSHNFLLLRDYSLKA